MPQTSRMHVSVVGTGFTGTPKGILICTDNIRYLINCGEGTQRIITEHRSKASCIQHVFFTQMSWKYFSGLLGVALTVKTAGVKRMFLHGPPNGAELMNLTRHFADEKTTDVVQSDILDKPLIDENFKMTAFEIQPSRSSCSDEPSEKRFRLDHSSTFRPTYAFLFQAFRVKNKLDPIKCIELGIPKDIIRSPAIRKLIDGEPLVLPDGKVISPSDVTTSAPAAQNILVVDCPCEEFIPPLLENGSLYDALSATCEVDSDAGLNPGVSLVIHFLPQGLFDSQKYQHFRKRLDKFAQSSHELPEGIQPGARHLVLDGRGTLPPVSGIYTQSAILNSYFDQTVYPRLGGLEHIETNPTTLNCLEPFSSVVFGEALLKYSLRPHTGFSAENCIQLDEDRLVSDVFDPLYVSKDEAMTALQKMKKEISCAEKERGPGVGGTRSFQDFPELTFLGTASSCPSKYRNVSGILLRLNPDSCLLLDCGEGTLNQLYILYGVGETHRLLRSLKLILLTHMHADHHGGIFTIAMKRRELLLETQATVDPLAVLAPTSFVKWTESFGQLFQESCLYILSITNLYKPLEESSPRVGSPVELFDNGSDTITTPDDKLSPRSRIWCGNYNSNVITEYWNKMLRSLKMKIHPVKVPHTGTSWAYVLESLPDTNSDIEEDVPPCWKIVYSGDTPPHGKLAEAGRGCDLLIHEATMADGYEELAVRARHSTMSEAVSIGRAMQAKFILLNHFSQRFSRLPNFDNFQEDLAPTFDFMRVRLSDLWKLPYLLPYYKSVFVKDWGIQQARSDARHWRKLRSDEASEKNISLVKDSVG